jgi:hypothetical protein
MTEDGFLLFSRNKIHHLLPTKTSLASIFVVWTHAPQFQKQTVGKHLQNNSTSTTVQAADCFRMGS